MPTEEENSLFLYRMLTTGGEPVIDWDAVGLKMELNKGAVSKRWSRVKKAVAGGEDLGPSAYEFLWRCFANSKRDKAIDWSAIAKVCNTTPGAASKRYSRMKIAFEKNGVLPKTAAAKNGNGGAKSKAGASVAKGDAATSASTKRKRGPAKKQSAQEEQKIKPEPEDDEEDIEQEPVTQKKTKRAKASTTKANTAKTRASKGAVAPSTSWTAVNAPKQTGLATPDKSGSVNPTEATTLIKFEQEGELDSDEFHDAPERFEGGAGKEKNELVHTWLENSMVDGQEDWDA